MIDWPKWGLYWMVRDICGPEDELDPAINGDIDSLSGEEDESGFDDMPVDCGWEDDGGDDDGDDCEENEDE